MRRKIQPFLPGLEFKNSTTCFGGEYSRGKRKAPRPISIKKPMHVVMRAEKARGVLSLRNPRNFSMVNHWIKTFAKRFDVKIYRYSINSNHVHIALRAKTRESFQNYLRATAGVIGLKILNAASIRVGKFWDLLAFSRIVEWGRGYEILLKYVLQNQLEAEGSIAYRLRILPARNKSPPRKTSYPKL